MNNKPNIFKTIGKFLVSNIGYKILALGIAIFVYVVVHAIV